MASENLLKQYSWARKSWFFSSTGRVSNFVPEARILDIPFLFRDKAHSRNVLDGAIGQDMLTKFESKGFKALAWGENGVRHMTNSKRAVNTPDDLKGLKMRAPTRQVTKLMASLGATPVGMPLPGIPDALSKGTIQGAVIPWEVVPSVKVHELTKFHAEFEPAGGALYTTTFVMAMNKAKYNSLPADLKKIIDNNSGMATSAWLGKTQQAGDAAGRKSASDRNNTIFTMGVTEAQNFRRKSRAIEVEWVEDMNKKGFDGKKLLEGAKALIEKHTKTTK